MVRRVEEAQGGPDDVAQDEVAAAVQRKKELLARSRPSQMGFRRGNLLALKMRNVMTFREVELLPGPRLNMIIGPNGAGKSTIVNALCIVFAGNLSILGRSSSLGSYVKHGESEAFVEAVICDDQDGAIVIRREFNEDNKSSYLIDGVKARKGDVEALRKNFDIQLENLTQFLPQEKIAQFTELTPPELLKSTMSALGGETRVSEYDSLMRDYDQLNQIQARGAVDEKSLEQLRAKNAAIDVDVQLYHERQQILDKIKVMEMLCPWMLYEAALGDYDTLNEDHKAAELDAKAAKAAYKAAQVPVRQKEEQVQGQAEQTEVAQRSALKTDKKLQKALESMETFTLEVEDLRTDYDNVEKTAQEKLKRLEKLQNDLRHYEEKLKDVPDRKEVDSELKELQDRRMDNHSKQSTLQSRLEDQNRETRTLKQQHEHTQRKLTDMSDKKVVKMRYLERKYYDLRGMMECLERNRHLFRGPVVGPIALEVNTESEFHATVLNMTIPKWLRCCFVVETAEDHSTLSKLINDNKFEVQCVSTPDPSAQFRVEDFSRVTQFGIYDAVVSCFDAPTSIKRVLCAHAQLHRIMVGDKNSTRHSEAIVNANILSFFTPDASFSARRSRYSNAFSKRSNPLHRNEMEMFRGVSDDEELRRQYEGDLAHFQNVRQEAEAAAAKTSEELEGIRRDSTELDREYKRLKGQRDHITKLYNQVQAKRQSVQSMEQTVAEENTQAQKSKLIEEIRKREGAVLKLKQEMFDLLKLSVEKLEAVDKQSLCQADLESEMESMKIAVKAKREAYDDKKAQANELVEQVKTALQACQRASEEAKKKCPNPGDYKDQWEAFPDKLEELEQEIRQEKAKANSILGVSPEVVEEFNRRQRQIEELEKRVTNQTQSVETRKRALDERKDAFLRWLDEKVNAMSLKFQELYAQIGCAGELRLKHGDLKDIHLEVLVSYRNKNEMRELSGQTHSGGERMVATMLYHFALQGLTPAPFRVVDEMNQGMDSIFERKILDIMLNDANKGASPQCFLITPKLLLHLAYNENTVTHIILNGDVDAEAWSEMQRSLKRPRVGA